jgi:hypothetical protein
VSLSASIWGARLALAATVVQIPVGLWMIGAMGAIPQRRLMGADPVATMLLIGALLTVFWLLHALAAVSFGETSRQAARRVVLAMVLVVVLMTGVLQRSKPPASEARVSSAAGVEWHGCRMLTNSASLLESSTNSVTLGGTAQQLGPGRSRASSE